jgi:hypothetical protein
MPVKIGILIINCIFLIHNATADIDHNSKIKREKKLEEESEQPLLSPILVSSALLSACL